MIELIELENFEKKVHFKDHFGRELYIKLMNIYSKNECFSLNYENKFFIYLHNENIIVTDILEVHLTKDSIVFFYGKINIDIFEFKFGDKFEIFQRIYITLLSCKEFGLEFYCDVEFQKNNIFQKKTEFIFVEKLFLENKNLFLKILFDCTYNDEYYGLSYLISKYKKLNKESLIKEIWYLLIKDSYVPYSFLDKITTINLTIDEETGFNLNYYEYEAYDFYREYKEEILEFIFQEKDFSYPNEYIKIEILEFHEEFFVFKFLIDRFFNKENVLFDFFILKEIFNEFEENHFIADNERGRPVYLYFLIKNKYYNCRLPYEISNHISRRQIIKRLDFIRENILNPKDEGYYYPVHTNIFYVKSEEQVDEKTIISICNECILEKILNETLLCKECEEKLIERQNLIRNTISSLSDYKREILHNLYQKSKMGINEVDLGEFNRSFLKENLESLFQLNLLTTRIIFDTTLLFKLNDLIKEEYFTLDMHTYLSFNQKKYNYKNNSYIKNLFASKLELSTYNQLIQCCSYYHISIKTRMIDVISEKTPNLTKYEKDYLFKAHLDFVIYSRETLQPILIIECDGDSHSNGETKNDIMKNSIIEKSGLEIVRLTTAMVNKNEVALKVGEILYNKKT